MLDNKKIEKEAKQILNRFAEALKNINEEKISSVYLDRDDFEREENKEIEKYFDKDFKNKLLKNAPKSNKDFVIAEKGNWK